MEEMEEMEEEKSLTKWHELLGTLFEYLLVPVDISVAIGRSVMSESPKVDILLLRRLSPLWTAEQLALLPDGVRDSQASDILLEFKYTESFNEKVLQQALSYDFLYKQYGKANSEKSNSDSEESSRKDVQTFLLIAKKTQPKSLTRFGYKGTSIPGVYHSSFELARKIVLISLNELSDEPHNAFVKCFASRNKEKLKAFNTLTQIDFQFLTVRLQHFINGLKALFSLIKEEEQMKIEITPEMVMKVGKNWGDFYVSNLPVKERLAGLTPAERLAGLKPAEILAGLKPTEILAGFKPTERLAGLKPQELDELANYLNQRQQQKTDN